MPITEIKQPEEELLLNDIVEEPAAEIEEQPGAVAEPIDEEEFPDTFDDEPGAPVENKNLLKVLRDQLKDRDRRLAQFEKGGATVQRMKKPDLWEDCEGDPDRFEEALLAWKDNERKVDEVETSRMSEQQNVAQSWQQELQAYKTKAQQLAKPDFEDAETAVIAVLNEAQQSTIVMAAKDPARFIYALGRSPQRLAQMAQITNPIKLAAEVARIEGRTMSRKEPANIDAPLKGSAPLATKSADEKEEALIKEAVRTGSIDKLRAYRKSQQKAA